MREAGGGSQIKGEVELEQADELPEPSRTVHLLSFTPRGQVRHVTSSTP